MGRPIARMGDLTSHGGTIITGAVHALVNGRPVARLGDLHLCPMLGHGLSPITSGSLKTITETRPTARMGDVCGCGAVIVTASPDHSIL